MRNLIVIISLFFTSIICFGQSNDLPNRKAFTQKLAVNDTNFYENEVKESPYFLPENTIQMYPGENLFIEVELINNEIKSMKSVKENLNPQKTLTIKFSQKTADKKHEMMMLSIENPFNKRIEYKALMYLMVHKEWASTSVLPIGAKLDSFEIWPDIITTIALTGWEFKDK